MQHKYWVWAQVFALHIWGGKNKFGGTLQWRRPEGSGVGNSAVLGKVLAEQGLRCAEEGPVIQGTVRERGAEGRVSVWAAQKWGSMSGLSPE